MDEVEGKIRSSIMVVQAAGVILQNWLAAGQPGNTMIGLDPFTGRAETLSRPLVAFAALKAIERIPEVMACEILPRMLRAYDSFATKTLSAAAYRPHSSS